MKQVYVRIVLSFQNCERLEKMITRGYKRDGIERVSFKSMRHDIRVYFILDRWTGEHFKLAEK